MQQHQGGGAHYGPPPPDMGQFSPVAPPGPAPLSSRPPPPPQPPRASYEELAAAGAGSGFPEDDMLGGGGGGGASGNRWPREETLALIRIRSEMDATFRDATLKGPLWEEVSRKLGELGYKRSAKKCKEKFENVHKYYKRTKEGRAGRQDGKSYRFFSQLEALHAAAPQPPASTAAFFAAAVSAPPAMSIGAAPAMPAGGGAPPASLMQPTPISAAGPAAAAAATGGLFPSVGLQGVSFSSMSESESDDESDDEDDELMAETGGGQERLGKRKRGDGGGGKKMVAFFEGLLKQVVERQEEMQRRFLETLEKREAERTAREEAWRRQEVARLGREQEMLAQERAAAASRDAAVLAFLQRIGGQPFQLPTTTVVTMPAHTPPQKQHPRQPPAPAPVPSPQPHPIPAAPLQQQPPQPQHKEPHHDMATPHTAPPPASFELVPVPEQHGDFGAGGGGESGGPSSSRWPKAEVHALIQLRTELENRYQEAGPKGPLWEEISAGMRRMGYSRNSKRCKEKWENINKYFKKVKESNKKRPEDSKTCPYFHQLDAIYRRKHPGTASAAAAASAATAASAAAAVTFPQQHGGHNANPQEIEGKNSNDGEKRNGGGQAPTSNGESTTPTAVFDDSAMKKPEDIVKELSEQPHRGFATDETDSDDMGDHSYDEDDGDGDDGKMQYRIQFQRPNAGGGGGGNAAPATAATTTSAPASTPASPFLAMVQ